MNVNFKMMKKLLLITLILLLTNCSTTQLVDTWRNPDITEFSSSKILIVGMTSDRKARKRFEKQLRDEYLSRGINAVMSLDILETSITSQEKSEEELITLEKKLMDDGFDSVLFSKVIGIDDAISYNSTYRDTDYGFRNFRDDYYTNQDIYYNPEYYIKYKIYHAETSLYCLCSGKDRELIWKGYIDIVDPESTKKTVEDYVHLVMYALEQEQLINVKEEKDKDKAL